MNKPCPQNSYASLRAHPPVVAWRLEEGDLCYWAEPDSAKLRERGSPSCAAKTARCRLVPIEDYKAMLAAWRNKCELHAEVERLREALRHFDVPFCPYCGPRVSIDEDGCCKFCGCDTYRDVQARAALEEKQ